MKIKIIRCLLITKKSYNAFLTIKEKMKTKRISYIREMYILLIDLSL